MLDNDINIYKLLKEDQKITFLVGAGCSVDTPSNLPAGRSMMDAIIKYVCAESEVEKISNLEELRFEALIEIVKDKIDEDLKIIDFYGLCDKPNNQHFFFADMIKKGHYVMTTNFDFLIEYALLNLNVPKEEIVCVITKEDFKKYCDPGDLKLQGKKLLYKIHGSTRNLLTGEDTRQSLITTIQAFGSNKESLNVFQVEPFKRPVFDNISKFRSLVVMGYSGSDDFDVIPTLKVFRDLNNVIWMNYIGNDDDQEDIIEIYEDFIKKTEKLDKINEILIEIKRKLGWNTFLKL